MWCCDGDEKMLLMVLQFGDFLLMLEINVLASMVKSQLSFMLMLEIDVLASTMTFQNES